jgi:hypothetical protein
MSLHFTKKAAEAKARELNAAPPAGRSSGWVRLDYGVCWSGRWVRRWKTYVRTSSR